MLYSKILRALSPERFAQVLARSSRQAKEGYFARHQIRVAAASGPVKLGAGHKMQARLMGLHAKLQQVDDEAMCEEMLRFYLLGQRPMLAAALDHLGIPHEDGLTESEDVAKLATMTPIERAELVALVVDQKAASQADVELYLAYMAANFTHEQQPAAQAAT